jgi:hypothetical protein
LRSPVVHPFFQFSQQLFIELYSPGCSPAHHCGIHEGAAVEEGHGRGFDRRHFQDLFPCIGALAKEADNLFEFVDVELFGPTLSVTRAAARTHMIWNSAHIN